MKTLALENVSKRFGAVEVLNGISVGFEQASVTALVGDNGAGKSTLLKIIAGIHRPDSGRLLLGSADVSRVPAAELRNRGVEMVYQDLALAPQQDVVTNLFMGREKADRVGFLNRSAMRKEAERSLAGLSIKIPDLRTAVGNLSGGQQQAVAIARAVMFEPKVLLLDEPTAALAAREVETVLALIQQQRKLGRCVILVSHRLNDVLAVADRVVVLKHGKIFSDDSRADLTLSQVVEKIVS